MNLHCLNYSFRDWIKTFSLFYDCNIMKPKFRTNTCYRITYKNFKKSSFNSDMKEKSIQYVRQTFQLQIENCPNKTLLGEKNPKKITTNILF